eukprot:SM000289S10406  [mRNA]  locus=s289:91800:99149:+ [translate_table: standard]
MELYKAAAEAEVRAFSHHVACVQPRHCNGAPVYSPARSAKRPARRRERRCTSAERSRSCSTLIGDASLHGRRLGATSVGEQPSYIAQLEQLRVLRLALAHVARGVRLPPALLRRLESSIDAARSSPAPTEAAHNGEAPASQSFKKGELLQGFWEEVSSCTRRLSAAELRQEQERRIRNLCLRRIEKIERCGGHFPPALQDASSIELHSLRLLELQKQVRYEVSAEKRLLEITRGSMPLCDWGLLRLRKLNVAQALARWEYNPATFVPAASKGTPSTEVEERNRKKKEMEVLKRQQEDARAREAAAKARFMNELQATLKDFQLGAQAANRRRRQRHELLLAWHAKQRQRASRAERLRVQALRSDDQEAYLRLVEESKNERLKTLLGKTDDLLQRLGAMVQKQKDEGAEDDNKELPRKDRGTLPKATAVKVPKEPGDGGSSAVDEKDSAGVEADRETKRDLLEGQRQYNLAVHSIEEKILDQPSTLRGGHLRQYQLEGLQWMVSLYNNNLNGILADEMGLGKTIQTIALVAYLHEKKGVHGPHLILAPKAVLPNWAQEFATWVPSLEVVMYDGRIEERKALRDVLMVGEERFNVLLTHYDLIMRDKQHLRKIRWHYIVVDEGHRLKNHESMLGRTLVSSYHIRRRLLLTGTPIQNSLTELWSLLNFLLPAIFNSSGNFEEWFNAPFADKAEKGIQLTEEEELLVIRRLHQVIRPFLLRRKKAEVEKDLPQKTQVILKCDLSAWQRIYYKQILESGRVGLESTAGKSRGLLNTAMQLRKVCNHPYLFLEGGYYEPEDKQDMVRASGKFELLDRLLPKLHQTGHRVLLFSQMTRLIDILEEYLEWKGMKFLRLDGNTKTEERGTLLASFNAPDSPYFIFLLSTRAGGLGLNLQTADTVILFDSDWNPQMDQQAEDRAHRIGQKKRVSVFVLVSVGSIEEEILLKAKSKMGIDAKVIQAGLFNTTSTAQERREMLEEIMRRGIDDLGSDIPSEREINRLTARSDEEFKMFERMDRERKMHDRKKSRLMKEKEVPAWAIYKETSKQEGEEELGAFGESGKRKRTETLYTDALSDAQWLKVIDEGKDIKEVMAESVARQQRRRSLAAARKVEEEAAAEASNDAGEDDSPEDGKDSSESEADEDIEVSTGTRTAALALTTPARERRRRSSGRGQAAVEQNGRQSSVAKLGSDDEAAEPRGGKRTAGPTSASSVGRTSSVKRHRTVRRLAEESPDVPGVEELGSSNSKRPVPVNAAGSRKRAAGHSGGRRGVQQSE